MPKMNYSLKYGGIEEVLAGEGKSVENYEDIYFSEANSRQIIIPRVVGVYQTIASQDFTDNTGTEERYNEMAQLMMLSRFNGEDEVHGGLICLVYHPKILNGKVLKSLVAGKDLLGRLKFADCENAPDFAQKPEVSLKRVSWLLEGVHNKKKQKTSLNLLEREGEYFLLNQENYGLTRTEALNYYSLKGIIRHIKEGAPKDSGIITYHTTLKAFQILEKLAKRIFKE